MRMTHRPIRSIRGRATGRLGALRVLGAASAIAFLGACSSVGEETSHSSDDADTVSADSGSTEALPADVARSAANQSGNAAGAANGTLVAAMAPAERQRIYTGDIAMRVEVPNEVAGLADQIADVVANAGGSVDRDERTSGADASARLTLRVPPERVDDTMRELDDLAEVVNRSMSVDDVTAEYTDLEGRIAALEISTGRLRGFLGEAGDAGQIATIEGELTRREADLESMKGQLRVLADQVTMARIEVSISAEPPAIGESDDGPMGFGTALGTGWRVVGLLARWTLAVAGVLVPFAPVVALLVLPIVFVRRRRRQR